MLLRERLIYLWVVLASCSACTRSVAPEGAALEREGTVFEDASMDGGSTEGRGAILGADAEPSPTSATLPRSGLEAAVDRASLVFVGIVRTVARDSVQEEIQVGDERWRVFYDVATVDPIRGLGLSPQSTLAFRLPPSHCEGTFLGGLSATDSVLSLCTGRDDKNSPQPGQRILGFLRYGGERIELFLSLSADNSGSFDTSWLDNTPARRSEARIWDVIAQRWAELGRPS